MSDAIRVFELFAPQFHSGGIRASQSEFKIDYKKFDALFVATIRVLENDTGAVQ